MKTLIFTVLFCLSSTPIAAEGPVRNAATVFRSILRYSVRVRRDNPEHPAAGSGTILSTKDGTVVLTCAHVVGKETSVFIDFDEEGKPITTVPATVLRVNEETDLALLKLSVSISGAPIARISPQLYDELYTIGSPVAVMRQSSVLRVNTKDALTKDSHNHTLWTVSGTVIPGMSGAGVFNDKGELVAVVKACMILPPINDRSMQILTSNGFVISLEDVNDFLGAK